LERCVRKHQDQIGSSDATIAIQKEEIRNARQKMAEQHAIQSALCAKVRKLTAACDSLSKNVQELQAQATASQQLIRDGQKKLAGLRFAILDAWRLGAQISKDRVEAMRHEAVSLTRTAAALSSTSLSTAQRRLANWLQDTLESWVQRQVESLSSLQVQVEHPVFQEQEFNFVASINDLFKEVRANSAQQDFGVQTSLVGETPGPVRGDAAHIHQLFTMLTGSVCKLVDLRRLELQVSAEPGWSGPGALTANLVLTTDSNADEMCARLAGIAAVSDTLQAPLLGDAESSFAACWQMAQAMGGLARIEAATDQDIRLLVTLPIAIVSRLGLGPTSLASPISRDEKSKLIVSADVLTTRGVEV